MSPLRAVGLALALAAALMPVSPDAALAQSTPTPTRLVTGHVINGTPGGTVPSDLQVSLFLVQGNKDIATYQTKITADNEFAFADVQARTDVAYFVVVEYQNATYMGRADDGGAVELLMYETTTDPADVHLTQDVLLLDKGNKAGELIAREIAGVQNKGTRTLIADIQNASGPTMLNFLRFSLPADYRGLSVESDLVGGTYLEVDRGFAVTSPVAPGRNQVLFTYVVPYKGGSLAFQRSFPFGVGQFRLLVPQSLAKVTSPDLPVSTIDQNGATYFLAEVSDLNKGVNVRVDLHDLAQPSLPQRIGDAFTSGPALIVGIPALAGLVLLVVLFTVMRRRSKAQPAPVTAIAPAGDVDVERRALLEAIAHLDDRYERKELPEEQYQAERADLKGRLLLLERRLSEEQGGG